MLDFLINVKLVGMMRSNATVCNKIPSGSSFSPFNSNFERKMQSSTASPYFLTHISLIRYPSVNNTSQCHSYIPCIIPTSMGSDVVSYCGCYGLYPEVIFPDSSTFIIQSPLYSCDSVISIFQLHAFVPSQFLSFSFFTHFPLTPASCQTAALSFVCHVPCAGN